MSIWPNGFLEQWRFAHRMTISFVDAVPDAFGNFRRTTDTPHFANSFGMSSECVAFTAMRSLPVAQTSPEA
jgi:hypothetical protein